MSKAKSWAYTSLSDNGAVRLEIEGVEYTIVQVTASFALNEIPRCLCTLALGRNAADVNQKAAAHNTASGLNMMRPAKVYFKPSGDYTPTGESWPDDEFVIFDGYFQGFSYRKSRGKVQLVANLIHWLVDLGFSSALNAASHPANPFSMVAPASVTSKSGGSGLPANIASHIGNETLRVNIQDDVWGGMKQFFCQLAGIDGFNPSVSNCFGTLDFTDNSRATKALARIEGPGEDCVKDEEEAESDDDGSTGTNLEYDVGKPTQLTDIDVAYVWEAAAEAIAGDSIRTYAQNTFWDIMVGKYFPAFALELCPMIDRAVVNPSLPGYRGEDGTVWRELPANEYTSIDITSVIPKPLKGVAMLASVEDSTGSMPGSSGEEGEASSSPGIGGCYGSAAAIDEDGALLITAPPAWLRHIPASASDPSSSLGIIGDKPEDAGNEDKPALFSVKTATSPDDGFQPKQTPESSYPTTSNLMSRLAQVIFIQNNLRGRTGAISGKLRFDIAPGSHIKIVGNREVFLGGEDDLASPQYCQVTRVTIDINAENGSASTSFQLSHLRNPAENEQDRTSATHNPLYTKESMVLGAPLLKDLSFAV